jgi:putative exporter of polyketide antibiotics
MTVLFLLSVYNSKKEKQVEILTTATPVNKVHYALVRSAAVTICFLIIYTVIFCLGIYFYRTVFGYRNILPFLLPSAMIVLPCFVFAMGIGYLAGRVHQGLLYGLMIIVLVVGFAGFGGNFDFFGHWYFNSYPISLPVGKNGEPAFMVSSGFLIARLVYLVTGGLLLAMGISTQHRKAKKA